MTEEPKRRGDWRFRFLLAGIVLSAFPIIFVRHHWPKLFTSEDIAIFAAGVTLATAITSVRAAQTSRDAAKDSLRALQLHNRPGYVRVEFHVRDPRELGEDPKKNPLPDPPPLWLSLVFRPPVQSRYEITWTDDVGQPHTRYQVVLPGRAAVEGDPVLLEGLTGSERWSGPDRDVLATVPSLVITCRDDQNRAEWSTPAVRLPTPTAFGSQDLTFNLSQ